MQKFIIRNNYLIQWLAGLGIPIALVISSWFITTSIEQTKLDSEYVKIALSILTSKHKYSNDSDTNSDTLGHNELALRRWAIRLLNKKSPEKFTDEEQKALLEGEHILKSGYYLDPVYDAIARALSENKSKR